jgi:tetratricopeptide (TPR) repeat protein
MQQEHHKQVVDFLKSGDYQSAVNFLGEIEEKAKDDSDYWYYTAHIARKMSDLKRAEIFCKKALELSPISRNANFEMGIIYQTTGEYKQAISFLKKLVENSPQNVHFTDIVDTLNSLALTYKKAGDKASALKYYNLALETLAQDIYEHIKGQPLREVEAKYPSDNLEGWMRLAFQIAAKNAAKDGIESVMIPRGKTAVEFLEQNQYMGVAMYDKDGARYLLPAYFAAFLNALRSDILYSNIVNNIGTLFAETGETEEAKKCFLEAINFTPDGVDYPSPKIGLKELEK